MKTIDSIAYVIFPVSLLYRSLDREKKKNLSLLKLSLYVTSILDFYAGWKIFKNRSREKDYFQIFFLKDKRNQEIFEINFIVSYIK